jgi:PadR family transcriptional regulator PadR
MSPRKCGCGHANPHRLPRTRQCPVAKLERYVEPCVLLLLAEQPSHGYELMERLDDSGLAVASPGHGVVYRTLRHLEKLGLVVSEWKTGESGPARRLYHLTLEGRKYLSDWRDQVEISIRHLQGFARRYDHLPAE